MANKNISRVRRKTHEKVDNIMDRAEDLEEKGAEKFAHIKERAIVARKNVDGYIQKNPETSVLIAAGIGLAIGAIITAVMMKKHD